jgi:hypothetical protein
VLKLERRGYLKKKFYIFTTSNKHPSNTGVVFSFFYCCATGFFVRLLTLQKKQGDGRKDIRSTIFMKDK